MHNTSLARETQHCLDVAVNFVLTIEPIPSCPYNNTFTVLDVVDNNKPLPGANLDVEFTERLEDGRVKPISFF